MLEMKKLVDSIMELESELRNSGKHKTADFFNSVQFDIESAENSIQLKKVIEQYCSSGAITQYADFSFREEELFDKSFAEAQRLLLVI